MTPVRRTRRPARPSGPLPARRAFVVLGADHRVVGGRIEPMPAEPAHARRDSHRLSALRASLLWARSAPTPQIERKDDDPQEQAADHPGPGGILRLACPSPPADIYTRPDRRNDDDEQNELHGRRSSNSQRTGLCLYRRRVESLERQAIVKLYRNREPRPFAHRADVTRTSCPTRLLRTTLLLTVHRNRNVAGGALAGGLGASTV